jgi:hypothetical protein
MNLPINELLSQVRNGSEEVAKITLALDRKYCLQEKLESMKLKVLGQMFCSDCPKEAMEEIAQLFDIELGSL